MELVAAVRDRLAAVLDPELGASIVELGMVGDISVDHGHATICVALTTASCPLRSTIETAVTEAALEVEGIATVTLTIGAMDAPAKAALMRTARRLAQERAGSTTIPPHVPIFMIASGKGGVGKSSVTANLARSFARQGKRVGVLDADIWGFSLTQMLDITGDIDVRGGKMLPLVRAEGSGSIALLSMGLLSEETSALLWRGLMVQKAVAQFLEDADWSRIDVMLIDTPPGTGDIVMTLSRLLPRMRVAVVTTPEKTAQGVASRSVDFARKSNLDVIGIIENMSAFSCACGAVHAPFGSGGGQAVAEAANSLLLGAIPLGDLSDGVFDALATTLWERAPHEVPIGCSARLLETLEDITN